MALAETETWQGGFIRDDSGNLVVTTDPAEEVFGTVVPGFLTDGDGRLVATYEPDEDTRTVVPGFVTDTAGRLAIASEVANPVYTVVPGFATDSSGYLYIQENPSEGTYQEGFVRDTDGALGVGATYVASPYEEAVQSLSPSYFVALDSVNGITDLSGNGHVMSPSGAPTIGGYADGPLAAGDTGATDLDGSTQRLPTNYAAYINGRVTSFMGWAYRDVNTAVHNLIGNNTGASDGTYLILGSGNNTVSFDSAISQSSASWADAWPGVTQWVHWALVFDEPNDEATLYINGSAVSTQTQAAPYDATPGTFQIGASATSQKWNGKVAWVSVHEAELTSEQVAACYAAGS